MKTRRVRISTRWTAKATHRAREVRSSAKPIVQLCCCSSQALLPMLSVPIPGRTFAFHARAVCVFHVYLMPAAPHLPLTHSLRSYRTLVDRRHSLAFTSHSPRMAWRRSYPRDTSMTRRDKASFRGCLDQNYVSIHNRHDTSADRLIWTTSLLLFTTCSLHSYCIMLWV